jgi:hypothetical protein
MDPTQMYEGADHSPVWAAVFLTIAVVAFVALMAALIIGIDRSYRPPRHHH